MICAKDILFHILYNENQKILNELLQSTFKRLEINWKLASIPFEKKIMIFFLIMDRDITLKNIVIEGNIKIGYDPISHNKAERFFLSYHEEVIRPWFCDESNSNQSFLEKTRALYWSC